MTQQEIINKIKSASKIEDVISMDNFKSEYNAIIKEIHPDVCGLDGASDATQKMTRWKQIFENGNQYKDDCGIYRTNGYWVEFESKGEPMTEWSFENYKMFRGLNTDTDKHFQKYLPSGAQLKFTTGNVKFTFDKRAIPLSGLTLPQEHVNWILNRLLEYCAYLSQMGFSHCGLNPESVFIVPETHGIQICSFYHLTKIGNRIGTVSGKYFNWYPQAAIKSKTADHSIDIELAKKIAIYLLGDKSGSGIKLRKTHNEDFINFVVNQSQQSPFETMKAYKQMLKNNFKSEFHLLTI